MFLVASSLETNEVRLFRYNSLKPVPITFMETMESTTQTNPVAGSDAKTIQTLAKGIMELYEPPLATINTHLEELTERQEAVKTMITSEKRKLDDLQNDATLDALLADVATNREKLVSISNSMMSLHKRVQSLQTRAANVERAAKQKANQKPALSSTSNS